MYSIKCDAVTISSPQLKSAVTIKATEIDGTKFIRLCKTDRKIARLLCPTCDQTEESRPMTKSTIIETLIGMRNTAFNEAVTTRRKHMRYGVNTVKRQILELEETVTIEAPSVGDIPGIKMQVMFDAPSVKTVAVELTNDVLVYLSSVIQHQRDNDAVQHDQRDACGPMPTGVTAVYKNGELVKYRAQYKYERDGKKCVRNAYFKVPDAADDIIDLAKNFTVTGCRDNAIAEQLDDASCASEGGCDEGDTSENI